MPPKRTAGSSPSHPHVKMIKIDVPDVHEFGSGSMEDGYRVAEGPGGHTESGSFDLDEDSLAGQGIRTDTISLLMKIEQLQAQLKYERRCRILAERELRELKEMNTLMMQMRHTANELRVTLDHVLHGGEAPVEPNSDGDVTFLGETEMQMRAAHNISADELDYLYLAENLRVPKSLYERVAEISDYKKYVAALLMIIFDRDTLATHCLQGRKNSLTGEDIHKPPLPPEILKSLMDHVAEKFSVDLAQVKYAIRTKLNNEDKLLKKRLGLVKVENRMVVDENFSQDGSLLLNEKPLARDSDF